jgi:hypothetical protein
VSDPLAPNKRNLLAVDISGPRAFENVARQQGLGGQPRVDLATQDWVHHDVPEFPTGKYVTRRDPETGGMVRVFLSNEELAAEAVPAPRSRVSRRPRETVVPPESQQTQAEAGETVPAQTQPARPDPGLTD